MSKTPASEAARRRTFAIISHPDAGKTTLTEHLLLLGGAIHAAGRVKARGEARRAKSDWMRIEQERGISVTSAVMTFEYENAVFNKLDREARDPLELLDEISDQLQLECAPMVWPVGMGLNFKGTIDLYTDEFSPFGGAAPVGGNALGALISDEEKNKLEEDVELARSGMPRFA